MKAGVHIHVLSEMVSFFSLHVHVSEFDLYILHCIIT